MFSNHSEYQGNILMMEKRLPKPREKAQFNNKF